jgi:hypothetical protein
VLPLRTMAGRTAESPRYHHGLPAATCTGPANEGVAPLHWSDAEDDDPTAAQSMVGEGMPAPQSAEPPLSQATSPTIGLW